MTDCAVCTKPIVLYEESHHPHALGCTEDGCRCDFPCHPWCCWERECRETYARPLSGWSRVGLGAALVALLGLTLWVLAEAVTAEAAGGDGPPVTIERAEPVLYEPEVVG